MSPQNQHLDPASPTSNYDEQTLEIFDINQAVALDYHLHLKTLLNDPDHPVTKYVRGPNRELTDEQITDWQLGFAPDVPQGWRFITDPLIEKGAFVPAVAAGVCVEDGDKKYDFFRNRLIIPLFDEARNIVGFTGRAIGDQQPKYLNTKETAVFKKGDLLFGLNRAKRSILREKHLMLTEGNFDVTTLHRFGLTETVGKGGTALTDSQIETIKRLAESVTLIYDVDPNGAGQKALAKDCEKLLEAGLRVKVFELPLLAEGGKIDADTWGRSFIQQQDRSSRNTLNKHVLRHSQDGLIWLAQLLSSETDIDTLVDHERRIIELLARVADEERQNKFVRKLALVFDRDSKEILKQVKKVKAELKRLQEQSEGREDEDDKINETVWYRNSDMAMLVKSGRGSFNTVANNFHLYVKYQTEDEEENTTWLLEVKPFNTDSIFIEVTNDDFTSASRLKKAITAKRYSLKANDSELSELQAFLFQETQFATAIKIIRYGYHSQSGVFFFANKALLDGELKEPDMHGMVMVERKEGTFVLSMPQQNKNKEHRFTLTDTQLSLNEFFGLYSTAHLFDTALIPFCFYLTSLYRDVALKQRTFIPILFLKGAPGTGKSAMVKVMTAAFGKKQEGVNLGSKNTEAALVKMMSQSANTFIWMDEYHHDLGGVEKLLQAMYDNDGYHRSKDNTSMETETVPIFQSLALTSNYLPRTEPFFDRCLFIPINGQEFTAQQTKAFDRLDKLQETGLGCLTVEALKHRSLVEKEYPAAFEKLYQAFRYELKSEKIPERFFGNMAQILTVGFILARAEKISLTDEAGEEALLTELIRVGANSIRRQYRIMADKTTLAGFFDIIQTLYDQYQIHEGIHFEFDPQPGERLIRLSLPQLYALYAERYRRATMNTPADKDTIQTELAILMECPDWDSLKKSIKFRNDGESTSSAPKIVRHNCCRVSYEKLQQRFGLNLEHRKPKSNGYGHDQEDFRGK